MPIPVARMQSEDVSEPFTSADEELGEVWQVGFQER